MRKYAKLTLALLLAFSFIAAATAAKVITVEKKSDGYSWVLQSPADPGIVEAKLFLRDASNKPVTGLVITGKLWMPEMPMQGYPLDIEFQEIEKGQYSALLSYAHGGYWQVIAEFKNGQNQFRQTFDLNINQ